MIKEIFAIVKLLKENIHEVGQTKVYAFGSAIRPDSNPEDIDLLIIYENPTIPKFIRKLLNGFGYIPIHLLFLTSGEEVETNFIALQECVRLV